MAGSIATAILLGMGLFVALPHFLTAVLTAKSGSGITAQSPLFHLLDGSLKMTILLTYVYLISMVKDIHRVFQYHGAEHKSIYAFEAGEELTVENARKYTTLHPRCGTSFLLFLVLISIGVFSIVFPLFHLTELSSNAVINHSFMILIKIVLMMPVAGVAYEFIKMCACRMDSPVFRIMIWPGMILQKLTTREPSDEQLEVALASLRAVLRLEKGVALQAEGRCPPSVRSASLSDLGEFESRPRCRSFRRPEPSRPVERYRVSWKTRFRHEACSINLNSVEARFLEIESRLADPDIASQPAEFRRLSQEHAGLQDLIAEYRRYKKLERRHRFQQRARLRKGRRDLRDGQGRAQDARA